MNAADIAIQALPTAFIMSGSVVVPARRTRLPIRKAPMTIFTGATLAALITSNDCVSPAVAPVKVGISHHDSALNALAIHDNVPERRYAPMSTAKAVRTASSLLGLRHSVDAGIAQVNSKNRPWTSLSSLEAVFDPCCTFISTVAYTLRASVRQEGPILECELRIRGLGSLDDDAQVAEEAAAECVLRAMEDEDDPLLSHCVAAAWDGAGG